MRSIRSRAKSPSPARGSPPPTPLPRCTGCRRCAASPSAPLPNIDALVLPTAPTVYSTAQVLANPIELNSRLGTYTNFVNLLDLCGLALPAAIRPDDIPFGITLLAPAGQDAQLASIGRVFHADTKLDAGRQRAAAAATGGVAGQRRAATRSPIAVVGAHLSGMVLNGELKALGGRLLEATIDRAGLQALCARHHAAETRHAARGSGQADRRSSWKSGRCRRRPSANSSPRSRRRCRSAPCASPTAAASRASSSNPPTSTARATSPPSAAGARLCAADSRVRGVTKRSSRRDGSRRCARKTAERDLLARHSLRETYTDTA